MDLDRKLSGGDNCACDDSCDELCREGGGDGLVPVVLHRLWLGLVASLDSLDDGLRDVDCQSRRG